MISMKRVIETMHALNSKWVTPDEIEHIEKQYEEHPEKKRTPFLGV